MHGVDVIPLKLSQDSRGRLMRMLRVDDPHFRQFGEIYFSSAYPGIIKGWHLHTEKTVNLSVIHGLMKLVLYDPREDSPSKGSVEEHCIGPENYQLVVVPPGIWYSFQAVGTETAILANCATHVCPPEESRKKQIGDPEIPYNWK